MPSSSGVKTTLAIAIAAWTLVAWGGRIGLLASGEGLGAWLRIGGSIVIGLFAAATLVVPRLEPVRRLALLVFALFSVVLWTRSLLVTWAGSGSLSFKVVHTVLAAGFFILAFLTWTTARHSERDPTGTVARSGGSD